MSNPITRRTLAVRGFSLIEMMVVCVILVALSAGLATFYFGHSSGKPGQPARSPMERGHDPVCINQLNQVRQALQMAQSDNENGKFPATLQELRGLPADFLRCPEGKEPYHYDPETGAVHCVHPGHEKF